MTASRAHVMRWYGEAYLKGAAALDAPSYPIKGGVTTDEEGGESVEFEIEQPVARSQGLVGTTAEQRITLQVHATVERVQVVAREALAVLADVLAFASGRRVELNLGALTTTPPGSTADASHQTVIPLQPFRIDDARSVNFAWLATFMAKLPDLRGDREQRIVRSMRWLRRALGSPDEVAEFTCLAFALEALLRLMPDPPSRKKQRDQLGASSDKLRHFALHVAHVTEGQWKLVGGLRHSLFHGGLTETDAMLGELQSATQILRLVVMVAVKHSVGLADSDDPQVTLPKRTLGRPLVIAPGFMTTTSKENAK